MNPLVISPVGSAVTSCMIFLHGLGDSGEGWSGLAKTLSSVFTETRFVLPHASVMEVGILKKMAPSWYNIRSFTDHDENSLEEASAYVKKLVDEQIAQGIQPHRIVLAGFSQGAAVSLFSGIKNIPDKIGGILALSGYLPLHETVGGSISKEKEYPKIFIGHGTKDSIVPYSYGYMTNAALSAHGLLSVFKSYDGMDHTVCSEETADIVSFLFTLWKEV